MAGEILLPVVVVALHLAALGALPLVSWLGARTGYALAVVTAGAAVGLVSQAGRVLAGGALTYRFDWLPIGSGGSSLRLDGLSLLFAVLVLTVGTLILAYCPAYVARSLERTGRFYAVLTAFAASMVGLVLAGDGLLLYGFWELTAIWSFLLIAHRDRAGDRRAAERAVLVTVTGGFGLLAAVLLAGASAGTFEISVWVTDPARLGGSVSAILGLLVLAVATKSVLVPAHVWLPGAMTAPTPVSAFLHAAAMVQAGIYLLARTNPLLDGRPGWRLALVGLGLLTALVGAATALRRHDLKEILAYSTISQNGMVVALLGVGTHVAVGAALLYATAHALYKSCLFLVTGTVDHRCHTRDLRELPALHRSLPFTTGAAVLAGASMAGLPPLLGYVGKEEAFAVLAERLVPTIASDLAVTAAGAAAAFTVAYTLRIVVAGFLRGAPDPSEAADRAGLWVAPAVLSLTGLGLGLGVTRARPLFRSAATAATGTGGQLELGLWKGATLPFWVSVLATLAGVGLYVARRRAIVPRGALDGSAVVDGLVVRIRRLGGTVARPLLSPVPATHLAIIATVTVAVLVTAWAVDGAWVRPVAAGPAVEWVVVVLLTTAGLAVARIRDRLGAIAALAAVGFLVAAMYVLRGAPDLVLTQLVVDVLTVGLIVFVFRHLPRAYPPVERWRRAAAAVIAVGVGVVMAAGTAFVRDPAASGTARFYLDRAPRHGGDNVVNTILTDFRAFDTLGELTVIAVAALGVVTLARGVAGGGEAGANPILRVVARLLTPVVLALSAYLLVRGHNGPGGGFPAAIVAGLVVVLRTFAFGLDDVRRLIRLGVGGLIGVGLVVAIATGLAGWWWADAFLASATWHAELPVVGGLELSSALLFEVGVFLTVVAVVVAVVQELGHES